MIDRLRKELQDRLDQLLGEAEKVRRALGALDPRGDSNLAAKPAARSRPSAPRTGRTTAPRAGLRSAPGKTKARVLAALSADQAKTAGQVATATGLQRQAVSTTLSRLAKSGEVLKAERGYRLP